MSDLVEWLTQILDEHQAGWENRISLEASGEAESLQFFGRRFPEFMLADIAAKRAIIEDYEDHVKTYRDEPTPAGEGIRFGLLLALARIAEGYADRPGYDVEWKP